MSKLAQVGQGDPKILAHPGFREMPGCQFELKTDKAKSRYDELCRLIWTAGRLSLDKHMTLSTYALLVDRIELIEAEGLKPRASWFTQLLNAQKRLELDDLDKPISAPREAPTNRFARFGRPGRR
jgi:hypothetical protein